MSFPFVKYRVNVFLISVLMASCYQGSQRSPDVFHYNEQSGIASLDPAFAKNQSIMWAIHQLYNTLVEIDDSLRIVPSLASRWEVSPDRKTYTFYLRQDVFFHDNRCFPGEKGRKLIAADIVYSFRRLTDPSIASPGAWIFNGRLEKEDGLEAVNDSVFRLRLRQPYSPILGILSTQYCSVVAPEAARYYGADFRRNPVGTGPFSLVAWEEGLSMVMKKNNRYFEKDSSGQALPYLSGVHVSFYDSKATEFLLFRQQQLDFINDIDPSFKDEVLTKRAVLKKGWEGKIQLQIHEYLNTEYFGILMDTGNALVRSSPLRQRKIRQAINYGIDREKLVLYLRNSIGTAAQSGFIPAGLPSFDSSKVRGYHFDPSKARDLLHEAGFPGGKGLPEIRLLTIAIYSEIAEYIARELEEIGIPVQVEVVQKSLLLELTSTSRAPFFRGSWIADYPDGENYLSVFYSKNPAPPNYTRFTNPTFDHLLEKALAETNDSLRFDLYRQADQLVMEEAPVVPLWYDKVIHLVQPGVQGFYPNSLNLLELRRTRLLGQ